MSNELSHSEFSQKSKIEYLSQLRIIKKNVINIVNFPENIAIIDLLESEEFLGQYGKMIKIIITYKINQENNKEEYSAYISYSNELEAALAILCIDSLLIEGKIIRAFFGTTKYCIYFLNNKICPNIDKCNFLHNYITDKNIIIDNNNSFSYEDHLNLAKKIIYASNIKINNLSKNNQKTQKLGKHIFPSIDIIFFNKEEKEKYFRTVDTRHYIKTTNTDSKTNQNNFSLNNYDDQKNNLIFNTNSENNDKNQILFGQNDFMNVRQSNSNYINNKDKSEYFISGNSSENIKNNSLSSIKLHNIFRKSINHILIAKPLFMALNNVTLQKLELEYFLNDLSKDDVITYKLLDGCLDPIGYLL